jgi:hypothetical protein
MQYTISNNQISTNATIAVGFNDPVSGKDIFIHKHQFINTDGEQEEKFFFAFNMTGEKFPSRTDAKTFKRNFYRADENTIENRTGLHIDLQLAKKMCSVIGSIENTKQLVNKQRHSMDFLA